MPLQCSRLSSRCRSGSSWCVSLVACALRQFSSSLAARVLAVRRDELEVALDEVPAADLHVEVLLVPVRPAPRPRELAEVVGHELMTPDEVAEQQAAGAGQRRG